MRTLSPPPAWDFISGLDLISTQSDMRKSRRTEDTMQKPRIRGRAVKPWRRASCTGCPLAPTHLWHHPPDPVSNFSSRKQLSRGIDNRARRKLEQTFLLRWQCRHSCFPRLYGNSFCRLSHILNSLLNLGSSAVFFFLSSIKADAGFQLMVACSQDAMGRKKNQKKKIRSSLCWATVSD